MKRISAVAVLTFVLLGLAAPAMAKVPGWDENMPVSGSATIAGPGLDHPLVARWHGDCLEYCGDLPAANTFADLVSSAGVFGAMRGSVLAQRPAGAFGPKYAVNVTIATKSRGIIRVALDLYPYGPGGFAPYVTVRPWFHIPAGQRGLFDERIAAGWRAASPLLLTELRRLGLPSRRAAEESSGSGLSTAGVAAGVAGFVLLILAGAIAGRPRRRAVRTS
jgi:hypothetical protein